MTTQIGLWIDHRKAVIVFESSGGEAHKTILSHADRQPGRADGKRSTAPYEANQVLPDDVKDRKFAQHLHQYYQEIEACVQHAKSLFIFGPGEAKGELRKHLETSLPKDCVIHVETSDKLTDNMIAAKVRAYFQLHKLANFPPA